MSTIANPLRPRDMNAIRARVYRDLHTRRAAQDWAKKYVQSPRTWGDLVDVLPVSQALELAGGRMGQAIPEDVQPEIAKRLVEYWTHCSRGREIRSALHELIEDCQIRFAEITQDKGVDYTREICSRLLYEMHKQGLGPVEMLAANER